MNNLNIVEEIEYSTVRIECETNDGELSTGTGFFFDLIEEEKKPLQLL